MDSETIKAVVEMLSNGGNAAAMFAVWLVFQGVRRLKKVGDDIAAIRAATELQAPKLDKISENLRDVAADIESLDTRLAAGSVYAAALRGGKPAPG